MQETDKDRATLFFEVCARIEGLCAQLYHFYSDIYQDNADMAGLWRKTALEEENHQKQFELALRICEDVSFDLKADFEWTTRIYTKMENLLQHVRQNPPDLVTALTKSIEMEEALAEMHLDSSVRFHDESTQKMFKALREFDQDHVKALRHALAIMTLHKSEMVG